MKLDMGEQVEVEDWQPERPDDGLILGLRAYLSDALWQPLAEALSGDLRRAICLVIWSAR